MVVLHKFPIVSPHPVYEIPIAVPYTGYAQIKSLAMKVPLSEFRIMHIIFPESLRLGLVSLCNPELAA